MGPAQPSKATRDPSSQRGARQDGNRPMRRARRAMHPERRPSFTPSFRNGTGESRYRGPATQQGNVADMLNAHLRPWPPQNQAELKLSRSHSQCRQAHTGHPTAASD